MADLTTAERLARFGENEERVQTFVNKIGTYTTTENVEVETLPSFLVRKNTEVNTAANSILSQATAAAASAEASADLAAASAEESGLTPATTTVRGIGRVADVTDDVAVTNGPAFMAAGTAGALKQAVRADYLTSGDFDLLNPGTYICDNTAGGFVHAPTNFSPVFVYTKEWVPSVASYILYDEARSFEGPVRVMHRDFVPSRGTWSNWQGAFGLEAYSKVFRATSSIDARLSLQAASGNDNITLWPTGGKLGITRNTGDTSAENESMLLDPAAGTINGVLPAPRPTAANFAGIQNVLPSGGTWAYHIACFSGSTGAITGNTAGVAAGGATVITGHGYYAGFAWRVA